MRRSEASEAGNQGGSGRAGARRWSPWARRDQARKAQRRREALEALEVRQLLATLPAPIVVERDLLPGGGTLDNTSPAPSNESDPSIAVNRHNPSQLVAAWVRLDADLSGPNPPDIIVEAAYSNNGGATWQQLDLGGHLSDPATPADNRLPYNRAIDPTVGFDADGNAYLLRTQQNADGSSGALVLNKYDLNGGTPQNVLSNQIVYQWASGADRAVDASLAVDDGPRFFSDPTTGAVQDNPHSGNVYVAWASVDTAPANLVVDDFYNPNRILLVSSSDGGESFGGWSVLNDGGNNGLQRNARPRIVVSSGTVDGQIAPGRVTVVWDDFGSGRDADPPLDFIEADRPAAGTNVNYAVSGGIGDAVDPGSDPHTPTVTNFPFNVSAADARFGNFTTLSDLDVRVALTHPELQTLRLELVAPDGTTVLLLDNQTDANGDADDFTGASGANLGILNGIAVGTTFDQQATRSILDFTAAPPARGAGAPFIGHFRPQQSLNVFNGRTAAQLAGTWTLRVTDFRNGPTGTPPPVTTLNVAEVSFRSGLGATGDSTVAATRVIGSITDEFGRASAATPTGIGPGAAIAQDNTLGSFSPHQGRLYVTFVDWDDVDGNPADNTDVYLATSDDGGLSWTSRAQVNDDLAIRDGFSEGDDLAGGTSLNGRPQFQPSVAVDQATGTVALSWYDTRHDASRARVATFVAASIDGGASFSEQVFANQPREVIDAITGEVVVFEPIPDNQSSGNSLTEGTFGFGDDQGLAVHGGRIYPIWSSNLNGGPDINAERRLDVQVATVVVAAGPRVVDSTMGAVGLTDQFGAVVDPINNTTTADGTPRVAGFEVTFDRPVDPATFGAGDVRLYFRDATAGNASGGPVPVLGVAPMDPGPLGATRFRVSIQPRSAVGTYSYVVGPDVRDRVRTISSNGNRMDQDADAATGEAPATGVGPGDAYAAPRPTTTGGGFVFDPSRFFDGPYDPNTLPLVVSGPRVVSSRVPGAPRTGDNLVLDRPVSAVDVTFDRDMAIGSFTGEDVLRITGPTGEVVRPTPFVGLDDRSAADDRAIPDAPASGGTLPLVSTLEVPGDGTFRIADLDLRLDLSHGDLAQLTIELEGPDGTRATLLSGLPGTALAGTILDDESPLLITEGASPYTGRFRPTGAALSVFDGKELRGAWRLIVTDEVRGQTGTLRGWTLEATPLPQVAPAFNATAAGGSQLLSIPIPNGGTVNSALAVPPSVGTFRIADLTVTLDITHSRPADLTVALIGPGGVVVPLFAGVGGPLSTDFRNTTLDDAAETAVDQAPSRSFTGIYRPQGSLSDFDGALIQGTWTLRVVDAADPGGTAGTLNSWSLAAVPEDPSATAARTFRVSFPTQRIGGTYAVLIGPEVLSRNGAALDTNTNAGVDLLRGTAAAAPTVPVAVPSGDVPKALVDGGVTTSVLTVPQGFLIADLNVRLNIAHTQVPELTVVLIAPDGTRITLLDGVGAVGPVGGRRNFTNTVLDDQATTPIQNGAAPFFGTFNPQQPLGVLNGTQARGTWALEVTDASGGGTGTLTSWSLEFRRPVPNTGLGEPVADRAALSFRVFRMDPGDPLSGSVWTPVGPASTSDLDPANPAARQGYSGRVSTIAVDPSDPSGNTVYLGAASGGVWRTHDFLTTDPGGPTWVPLTDFGPTFGVHVGSIAVFPRNNDPNQSIILAATGEASGEFFGSTSDPNARGSTTQGVGFLRSTDGGATWELLDSTNNALPFGSRDHAFANNGGTASYKVAIDPTPTPAGGVIAYAALSGPAGGLWRSLDAGTTWQLMRAGNATDVALDEFSRDATTGNLNNLYAAFSGDGVYFSPNRGQSFNLMTGQIGVPQIRDADIDNNPAATVSNLPSPNGGGSTRITLAQPSVVPGSDPNSAVKNTLYQGWLYAAVSGADDVFQGVYLTKDFGQTWTKLRTPNLLGTQPDGYARPSNDYDLAPASDYFAPDSPRFPNPDYTLSLVVDPNNPEVVYLGGTSVGQASGLMRIDVSRVHDAHALVAFDHSANDGGQRWLGTNNADSAAVTRDLNLGLRQPARIVLPFGFLDPTQYTNLIRNPDAPFLSTSAILVDNLASLTNNGTGARWTPFDQVLLSKPGDLGPSTSVHAAVAYRDPLTGNSRLLFGNDQGIFSGVDQGDRTLDPGIGTQQRATFSRVGNLQIGQVYRGAAQPTTLAAQLAGALFYAMTEGNGYPESPPEVLDSGVNWWLGDTFGQLNGSDVATDQQGEGTIYQYKSPGLGDNAFTFTEFFQVNGVPRTFGLIQTGGVSDPQWPNIGPVYEGLIPMGRFAVNPLNGDQVVISSNAGRIFATTNQGVTWSVVGDPGDLGGSYAPAVAYGAPDPAAPGGVGNLGNFIYAGTVGGQVFVTRTGGGSQANAWQNISAGLDGSSVAEIVPSPDRGSHAAYAVTLNGVYYTPDSLTTPWQNITGDLFATRQAPFGDLDATSAKLSFLTSVKADWRYSIPEDFGDPGSPRHPLLYVSGNAGVYRSLDNGQSWSLFPTTDDGAPVDGGYLPGVPVTDLDMALGRIDPTNGRPIIDSTSPNVLLASTFGRGSFAVRLAPQVLPGSLAFAAGSDSGASATDRVTNVVRPTIEGFSAQTAFGAAITVQLIDLTDPANPVIIGTGTTDSAGRFSIQVVAGHFRPDGTTDGAKVVGVQAIDQSGTRGNVVNFEFTLDTVAPLAPGRPDLQPGSDSGLSSTDNITNITSPTFDVNPSGEPGTTVLSLLRNGNPVVSGPVDTLSPTTELTDPGTVPDGTHAYAARQVDLAGNVSPVGSALQVTVDTVAPAQPAPPDLDPADDTGDSDTDNVTSNTRPRFNGTTGAVGIAELLNGAGAVLGTVAVNGGPFAIRPDAPLVDGTHTLRFRVTDVAGNVSAASAPLAVEIDTTPPDDVVAATINLVAADDSGVIGDRITSNVRPRFEGRAAGMIVELVQVAPGGPIVLATGVASADNRYLLRPTVDLPEGVVTVQTVVRDAAGNEATSPALDVTIDTTGPDGVTTLRLRPSDDNLIPGDNVTSRRRPVFEGTTEPGSAVELIDLGGQVLVSGTADANGNFALSLPQSLRNGTITLRTRARDVAGNQGGPSAPLEVRIVTVPDDLDGDGRADAAVYRSSTTPGLWSVIPSGGSARFTVAMGQAGDLPISGDFDGDGKADLAVWSPATATFTVRQSTLGLFQRQLDTAGTERPAVGDYDGDGRDDLAVYNSDFGFFLVVLSSGGAVIEGLGATGGVPVPGDYDGDGKDDYAVFNQDTAVWTVRRSSDGELMADPRSGSTAIQFGAPANIVPTDPDVAVPGDYDGDGTTDLAVFRQFRAEWFIWYGSPDGLTLRPNGGLNGAMFQFGGDIRFLPRPDVPTPGDYNGDGKTDLSIYRPTDTGQYLTWLSGSPANQKQIQRDPATGLPPVPFATPVAGDLPVQSPLGYKLTGGAQMHLPPGGSVGGSSRGVGLAAQDGTPAPDLGRTARSLSIGTPLALAPPPQGSTDPAADAAAAAPLGPWATIRERLLQHRRDRLAAFRARRGL